MSALEVDAALFAEDLVDLDTGEAVLLGELFDIVAVEVAPDMSVT